MHTEWLGGPWFSGEGLNPGPLWWRLGLFTLHPQGSPAACILSALPCRAFAIGQQLDGVYTVMIPGPSGG